MNVAFAPFLTRALRLNARTGRTYLLRTGVGLIFLFAFAATQGQAAFMGAPGLILFRSVTVTSAIIICLSGPSYFASVITDEKEQLTLGLLKMTGLRSFSLLSGLSVGQMVGAASLLLVILPFGVLSVALGGVSQLQVWAASASLLAHLFFVAGLGLLCSVVFARSTRAGGAALLLLGGFLLVPPIVSALGSPGARAPMLKVMLWEANGFLYNSSVFVRLGEVLSTGFSGSIVGFQAVVNTAAAAVCFVLAWALFEPCTRTTEGVAADAAPVRLPSVRRLRPGRAWRAAVAWKEFHFMAGGRSGMIGKTLLIGIVVLALAIWGKADPRNGPGFKDIGYVLIWGMLGFAALETVVHASRTFNFERRTGTLINLGTLPKSARRVAWEKMAGCTFALLPNLGWFLVGVLLVPGSVADFLNALLHDPEVIFVLGVVFLMFVLFLHVVAIFSLLLRRGGLIVAFLAFMFGMQFILPLVMLPLSMMGEMRFVAVVVCLATMGLILMFHWVLIRRLEYVMGE